MKINKSELRGMRYPALNDLVAKANNKYELVLATAKRAREIVDGSNPLIPIKIDNAISIATEEIEEDLVKLHNPHFKDGSPIKPLIDSDAIPTSAGFAAFDLTQADDGIVNSVDSEDLEESEEELDEEDTDEILERHDDEEAPFDDLTGGDLDNDVDLIHGIYRGTMGGMSDYDDN